MKTISWHVGLFLAIIAWICLLPLWIALAIVYLVSVGLTKLILNIIDGWFSLVDEARRS